MTIRNNLIATALASVIAVPAFAEEVACPSSGILGQMGA